MSVAEPEANSEVLSEFLDDYFAESDEHLTAIRRNLLTLEKSIDQPAINRSSVDELLRSFHSIKGISGMVGLREAELLAHQIETYLRGLRDGQLRLNHEGMDSLIAGTKVLESVIAGRRTQAPITDIRPAMEQIEKVVAQAQVSTDVAKSDSTGIQIQRESNSEEQPDAFESDGESQMWRFEFQPGPELAGRGINVNVIRARLTSVGELIRAAPRVLPTGGIAFEFLVKSKADEATFKSWADDGITYELDRSSKTIEPKEDKRQAGSPRVPSNTVRVDLGRLDDLMRMVGDLVISRSRLDEHVKHLEGALQAADWRPLYDTNQSMERQLRDLREGVMRVRMVPIGEIFERMHFVVRDLAREFHKKVVLELSGQQTEIDKFLVERMMDPILHLVRNAVSHGLEATDERVALGKPPEGRISLRASTVGETVVIEIEDDGRGIDLEQVTTRARELGWIAHESAIEESNLLDLICAPGFSTRQEADRASGRGVGMNVVHNTIVGLGGTLELQTEAGRSTRFTIQLPLTLAISDALIVQVGVHRFAIPQASVREVLEVDSSEVKSLEKNDIILYRGGVLPLLWLSRLFHLEEQRRSSFHAIVAGSGLSSVGVAVDRIAGLREIVVRSISDPLIQVAGVGGATELGDGRVVLILDAAGLVRTASGNTSSSKQFSA